MGKIGLIIKREYLTRVKKKSFIIMTILGPILMASVFAGAIYLSLSESGPQNILVVDKSPLTLTDGLFDEKEGFSVTHTEEDISDEEFIESDYTLMLYLPENVIQTNRGVIYYKEAPSMVTQAYIKGQMENILEDYKLDLNEISRATYAHINTKFDISTRDIHKQDEEDSYHQELAIVGFAFAFLIYMFVFMYGVQVMRGVIEEKTNRIVEVLISSVKPFQLMMGKIIGIAMVGLTQFLMWIVLTLILATLAQGILLGDEFDPSMMSQQMSKEAVQEMVQNQEGPSEELVAIFDLIQRINFPLLLGMFIFYFLGGYLIYAALFAAVGAAVDNETDTQQFMLPITIPLIFALMVGEFAITNPEGPAAFWFSIFPLTSPIVMMLRVAVGFDADSLWQLILSMALLIAGFLAVTWLAAKIYRVGILMYGKKVSYKEIWKWIKYH
ncbi:ABC transporter permease [Luteibaculum oceani]|uniref:ABC transporter permease n=1 Tax=Luteibaculum oceani TaxID=1294296 RepID=A0A5C6UZQ9_9FLAO|nr:ABC transporter permease [Luteibaculum oceani]TXC78399.1 ABC transporter permease [Luteibaculum oceani]